MTCALEQVSLNCADNNKKFRMVKAGKLPAFRVGSDWRFNREDIVRWLRDLEKKAKTRAGIMAR
jgi:excisionase family DNA binding protein